MLWGYEDPILKYLSLIPSLKLNATFALQQNDSSIDWLNYSRVKTGKDNINDVLEYIEWDGNMNLTYWGDEYANMINGTDASQFAPDVQDSTILQVYVDSIFR